MKKSHQKSQNNCILKHQKNIKSKPVSKSNSCIQPRITRRMKKIMITSQAAEQRCAICLSQFQKNEGFLNCGHIFCEDCLIKWWRKHQGCPFCRQQIQYMKVRNKIIHFEDLPPQPQQEKEFKCRCQLCWGDIDEGEQMRICTMCRAIYWHNRCLPFASTKWFCTECAGQQQQEN